MVVEVAYFLKEFRSLTRHATFTIRYSCSFVY